MALLSNYLSIGKKRDDKNLFAAYYKSRDTLKIDLAYSFEYITNYRVDIVKNDVHADVYTTSLINIFNRSKRTDIVILKSNLKYIYINDVRHEIAFPKRFD
jgi:hypothetical protein